MVMTGKCTTHTGGTIFTGARYPSTYRTHMVVQEYYVPSRLHSTMRYMVLRAIMAAVHGDVPTTRDVGARKTTLVVDETNWLMECW